MEYEGFRYPSPGLVATMTDFAEALVVAGGRSPLVADEPMGWRG